MERRRSTRVRHRLSAEILHAGGRGHGFLIDVSRHGAFLQIGRPVSLGEELEIWFADDQLAPQVARARVVRRRAVPGAAMSVMRPGIGVEWIEAPRFARALDESGIEVEIEMSAPEAPTAPLVELAPEEPPEALVHEPHAPAAAPVESDSVAATLAMDPASAPGDETPRDDDARSDDEALEPCAGEIVPVADAPLVEQTIELGAAAVRAEVVVIDEGDLGAFVQLAKTLGASTLRMRWGAQAEPMVWEAPPRIVIVPARVALAVPLSDAVRGVGALGVAVCDSEAHTLRARLRRQGYELIVQRAAHPETLRLLLASLLFRQRERRKDRRRPFGAQIAFWRGFRRARTTLLELSPSGGSLLASRPLRLGPELTVRIPAKHAGGRALALPAVVTRTVSAGSGELLGLRFGQLSARKRARLEALIAALDESGPVALDAAARAQLCASPASEKRERRRSRRVRTALQALAVEPATGIATDVLFGTDLSLGGMRVEPHPRLVRGAVVQLALQPPGGAPPVVLRAEVTRDEGERGLVLRFLAPPPAVQRALERILDAAAEVERTQRTRAAREAREARVVLGRLVGAEEA